MKSVSTIFENELKKRNINYKGPDADGNYKLNINGNEITVNLDNISKNYKRDKDKKIVINYLDQSLKIIEIPTWEKAKNLIFFSAEASDYNFGDTIHYKITDYLTKIIVITDLNESKITWITNGMIKNWKISLEEVEKTAYNNMSKFLKDIKIEHEKIDGMKLGMIPIESVFKASTIFSPNFKYFVKKEIGWPVLIVIPCRDFIFILSENDKGLLNRIGNVVLKEYNTSGYPITTEVLKISDSGIEAIGNFTNKN